MTDPSSHTDDPPLNSDSRWWSIDAAAERLMVRLRNGDHVARDLEEALARRRLRCMMRSINTGERQRVPAERWGSEISLRSWGEYGVMVVRYGTGDPGKPFRGWIFLAWGPDCEFLWPADPTFPVPAAAAPKRPESMLERARRLRASDPPPLPPAPASVAAPATAPTPPAPNMTAREQRKRRIDAAIKLLLTPEQSLVKAEGRYQEFAQEFEQAIPGLTDREYRAALRAARAARKAK